MNTVVPFKARGVRAELQRALDQRVPVRIQREHIQSGVIHGYVIGLSRDFCLVAEVGDAIRFDGYLAMAIADISALDTDPAREFVERALALRGETLVVPNDFRLDDWAAIARSAAAAAPLISINMIEDDEGEIMLIEINGAVWYPDTGAYEFEAIGSIGFGSGYLDALWQVAGAASGPALPRVPASDTVH